MQIILRKKTLYVQNRLAKKSTIRVLRDKPETTFGVIIPVGVRPMSNGRFGLAVDTTVLNLTFFFFGTFSVSSFRLDGLLDLNGYRMS